MSEEIDINKLAAEFVRAGCKIKRSDGRNRIE
jgi:hypothetical protein